MRNAAPSISVKVDLTNPGQFFACCGLLELADRLWPGTEGWFDSNEFRISCGIAQNGSMTELLESLSNAHISHYDGYSDPKISPLRLGTPFDLRLDWWLDEGGGDRLKTWAGQQSVSRIAPALKQAISCSSVDRGLYQISMVVKDPANPKKAVEPFYFDARRFAHALDTGFSLDVQNTETLAHPAVEFLCLIGLQRYRPSPTEDARTFGYRVWSIPLSATVASAAVPGRIPTGTGYHFQLRFRDNQKRYKAFSSATPIGEQS